MSCLIPCFQILYHAYSTKFQYSKKNKHINAYILVFSHCKNIYHYKLSHFVNCRSILKTKFQPTVTVVISILKQNMYNIFEM
jgi:hypothetical protein